MKEHNHISQQENLIYWVWLSQLSHISLNTRLQLLSHYEAPEKIFFAGYEQIKRMAGKIRCDDFDLRACEAALRWEYTSSKHHLIGLADSRYPSQLREIYDPPLLLYVKGNAACLNQMQVAMVGSRKQTVTGHKITSLLSRELAQLGVVVTSGLALGVDATAHRACIAGSGCTLAVLGCGIDRIYPVVNRELFEQVVDQGCLISEFPLGSPPKGVHFPIRNRLISGLSSGVVVIEAALKSGSMITARLALEQGREVFAVPGSPLSSQSQGCNYLIQQGAKLVQTVDDILEELVLDFYNSGLFGAERLKQNLSNSKQLVEGEHNDVGLLKWVSFEPISQEEIIQLSGLTSAEVSSMLLDMEIDGSIYRDKRGFYSRLLP